MGLGLLAGLISFSLMPTVAQAVSPDEQLNESILLSPVSKHYELKSGASKSDSFKVVNDGKSDFDFVVYARPYSVGDESYEPNFTTKAQNADAYRWVQFDQPSYHVPAGQTVDVKYTIRIPTNATPGGHYGVLFAETRVTNSTSGSVVNRTKRVGSILYVTVQGDITTAGNIKGFDIPFFQFKAPLKIRERVVNKGNTDFSVGTRVRAYDVFGGLKYKADKEATVLPGTTRAINNDWVNPAWIGVYKVEQTVKFLDTNQSHMSYILLIPIWVYAVLALLIGGRLLYAVANRQQK